jgi:hypothetical protein
MKSLKAVTIALLLLTVAWAYPAYAQSDRGTLTGTVTDPTGAVVSGARVVATNLDTGGVREVTTNDEGNYTLPELSADPYRLTVEAPGFKTATIENIQVAVQVTRSADVQLEIGVAGETVTVTADTSVLQTESPVQQTNVTERQIKELPLQIGAEVAGRSPLSFIFLDSSVTSTSSADPDQANSTSNPTSTSRFRVNGGQGLGAEILVDGASVRRSQSGTEFSNVGPGPNAFQEFTISTNSFSAEFGNSSGGVINFTTKSGGNEFHGEAYEFFRDESLDANGFFRNANSGTGTRQPLRQNDYGFNVGGPIYLPRFGEGGRAYVSGKNRAFFFFNYNGFRFQQTEVSDITVPTLRMRQGDFGELLTDPYILQFFGGPLQIYDPTAPNNPNRPLIPNNDLRSYRNAAGQSIIDPIGQRIAQVFPEPTRPGVFRNYRAVSTRPENTDNATAKVDFIVSDNQRLSGSYSFRKQNTIVGFRRFPGDIPAAGVFSQLFNSNIVRVQHDYTISPTVLNHFNFGFNRYFTPNRNLTEGFDNTSLGFAPRDTQNRAFPLIGFPNFGDPVTSLHPFSVQGIGSSFFSDTLTDRGLEFSDFLTVIKGRHSMRFGGSLRHQNFRVQQLVHPGGEFNFQAFQTSRDGSGGHPIASLLTGSTEFSFNSVQELAPDYRQFTQAYFFQDDIKVTPKLTVNLGIRYDLPGLRTEAQNRFRTFDPTVPNPEAGGRLGAITTAGGADGGIPARFETLAKPDRSNIAPRLGFAYALNNRTVVRGGAGLYYAPILYGVGGRNTLTEGTLGYNSPVDPNINGGGDVPDLFLRNYRDRVQLNPRGQFLNRVADFFDPNFRTGRTVQYSLDLQRELPYNFAVQVGYSGNVGTRLRSNFNRLNALPLNALRLGTEILTAPLSRITNPENPADVAFATAARSYAQSVGVTLPTSNNQVYPGFNRSVSFALRPFPQYSDIRNQLESQGRSEYNALQVKLDRRFTQGIQFGLSYTFSRLETDASEDLFGDQLLGGVLQSPYLEREFSVSPNDVPHAIVFNYIIELPFGKGRRFLNQGGIVDKLFGGFQISAIHRYQSGLPFRVSRNNIGDFLTSDVTGFGGNLRPNLTGQPIETGNEPSGLRFQFANQNAFAPTPLPRDAPPFLLISGQVNPAYAAFFNDPNRFFGNAPAVLPDVRLPAFLSENMSLLKKTNLSETTTLELGIEAFNILNRTRYTFPDINFSNGFNAGNNEGFGTAGVDANNRRTVQLRARFVF